MKPKNIPTIWDKMSQLEKEIRSTIRTGMTDIKDGSMFTIKYISGFEEFGSYETWAQGWVVSGKGTKDTEITVKSELMHEAINKWLIKYKSTITYNK